MIGGVTRFRDIVEQEVPTSFRHATALQYTKAFRIGNYLTIFSIHAPPEWRS